MDKVRGSLTAAHRTRTGCKNRTDALQRCNDQLLQSARSAHVRANKPATITRQQGFCPKNLPCMTLRRSWLLTGERSIRRGGRHGNGPRS